MEHPITSPIINFNSHEIDFNLNKPDTTNNWLNKVVSEEKKTLDHIDIIFCSDEFLIEMNKRHLDHDYYTDIITFPYGTDPISGELYISVDRVRDNAEKYDIQLDHEVHRVMVHGVLHLLGYNDSTEEEKKIMRAKEDHYLCQLFD